MRYRVVVPHVPGALCYKTLRVVSGQAPDALFWPTPARNPFAYASLWRRLWQVPDVLVVCEQDVVPPPDSIPALIACPEPWCTHPHWTGERYDLETFGLVKLSAELRAGLPYLMDAIATPLDSRYWVRRGWTNLDPRCGVATLNGPGRRACLRRDAPLAAVSLVSQARPTTHGWMGLDVALAVRLHAVGLAPHVHQLPTTHLHDYDARPAGSTRAWFELEYDEVDWPQMDQ